MIDTAWNTLKTIIAVGVMSLIFAGIFWYRDNANTKPMPTFEHGRKCPFGTDYLVTERGMYCVYSRNPMK